MEGREESGLRLGEETIEIAKIVEEAGPAAERIPAAELQPLLKQMRAHRRAGDPKAFQEADRAFHEAIVLAAGNQILSQLYLSLRDRQVRMGVASMQVAPARMDRSITDHAELIAALEGSSSKRFRELVAAHIQSAAANLRDVR